MAVDSVEATVEGVEAVDWVVVDSVEEDSVEEDSVVDSAEEDSVVDSEGWGMGVEEARMP